MRVRIGQTDIVIERGDITELEVDAIVNAANDQLSMSAGVAGAIKRKGGSIIEEDAVRQGPIDLGGVVVTTAGNLPASYVFHAAVIGQASRTDKEVVRRATQAAMRRAEDMRLQSIAFPAFGTGAGRMAPGDSADAMVSALRAHLDKAPASSLRRVHLVVVEEDGVVAFRAALGRGSAVRPR
jgi:O-acetyl-ADP-ribose deacetylase (regulator of RNase III)